MHIVRIIIVVLIGTIVLSCQNDVVRISPVGVWKYGSFLKDDVAMPLSASDILTLQEDSIFWYRLGKIGMYKSGKWSLQDSNLVLHYDVVPKSWGVDSLKADTSMLHYYYNGILIQSLPEPDSWDEVVRTFKISKLDSNRLEFAEDNLEFTFFRVR